MTCKKRKFKYDSTKKKNTANQFILPNITAKDKLRKIIIFFQTK